MSLEERFQEAARAIKESKALVITAGAGMGVDSGLPDFRGDQGFWKAYPPYEKLGLSFYEAANPVHFEQDPAFGWGFYGHRTNLYRQTVPHRGFHLLQQWCRKYSLAPFVVTSNVDGQFQKAGFQDNGILEVHGSIHHLQCLKPCSLEIWDNHEEIQVDTATMRCRHIPRCPHCGSVARPNILMFGDASWISDRTARQQRAFEKYLTAHSQDPLVVIEMGAGTAVPTIRHLSEQLGRRAHSLVVRLNLRESHIRAPHLSLPCTALEGLEAIDEAMQD